MVNSTNAKILLLLCGLCVQNLAKAQGNLSNGEGIITVTFSLSEKPGTKLLPWKSYRYFIKSDKILRKDSIDNPEKKVEVKKVEVKNSIAYLSDGQGTKGGLTSQRKAEAIIDTTGSDRDSDSITVVSPRVMPAVYLIDLTNQQTYTFYKKEGKLNVSIDSLQNHFSESLYKTSLRKAGSYSFQYLGEKEPEIVAGKKCHTARAINNDDTVYLKYTKQPLKVKSPLNRLVPGFPYPILSFDAKVRHPKTREFQANANYTITDISEEELDDRLFNLPKDVVIKNKVPLRQILEGSDVIELLHKHYY